MDYTEYTDYFEGIATSNVDINHNLGLKKKAFFRINVEEILSGLKSLTVEKGFNLALMNYAYQPGKDGADQVKEYDGGFMVVAKYKRGDFEDETNVRTNCERIADEIINRIKYDSQTKAKNNFWYHTQDAISDFSVAATNGATLDYVGVLVFFKFKASYDCSVDPNKWSDLNVPLPDPNDWASKVNP